MGDIVEVSQEPVHVSTDGVVRHLEDGVSNTELRLPAAARN